MTPAGTDAGAAPEAAVRYEAPAAGSAWTEDEHSQLSLLVTAEAGVQVPVQREKRVRRRVEVFGATAQIVTRARIAYLEHAVIDRRANAERTRPSPIAGRRYVLDAREGGVVITGAGGEPISIEEDAAIRGEEQRFGKPEILAMVVAGLRYRVGEPVAVPAASAARLFPGDLEVTAMKLTLVAPGEAIAPREHAVTFELRLALRGGTARNDARADAAGTLRVDAATGQPLELKVAGPVHLTGALVASGTLELIATRVTDAGWGRWEDGV